MIEMLKKVSKSLLIGTLAGLLVALVTTYFVPELIDRLEHQSYYMRYYWKYRDLDRAEAEKDKARQESGICVVDIDDRSQHKLGMYWNWNRSYHAKMIDALSSHFPAAIVFDINFYDPEDVYHAERLEKLLERAREERGAQVDAPLHSSLVGAIDYDEQFIQATRRAGNVYHGVRMSDEKDYPDVGLSQVADRKTMEWHNSLNPSSTIELGLEERKAIITSKGYVDGVFPELAAAAHGIGHLNVAPSSDGVIREVPLLYSFGKNPSVYLPISLRVIATLFGTPNEEIRFVPGKYIDIGRPFKVYKTRDGRTTTSYPNVSGAQVKAIVDKKELIRALTPGQTLDVSSFLAVFRSAEGDAFVSTHAGDVPAAVVEALKGVDLDKVLTMEVGAEIALGPETTIRRDMDVEWVIVAPWGDGEWYLADTQVRMLHQCDLAELGALEPGQRSLVYHSLRIENKDGMLWSSIPILRGETLRELCLSSWDELTGMEPGFRREFGKTVRVPLSPDNKHIVTYFGPRGEPFQYYSYYDIMEDRVQGNLEGKVFIVGSTVANMFDIVSVPLDNVYPGVEVHASLMNSFLTNTFVTRLAGWEDFLILLFVGIVMGFISYMLKPLPGAILSFVLVFGYFLIAMQVFGTQHLWIEIARPVLTIMLTFTAVMAYRYITEEKDRKFLQSTFKQYLSPELIDMMYKERTMPQLGGEEGVRTAYFTDIQSFSTFSEKLGSPTRLVELLNEYLTAMTDTLLANYGTLDKYEGDAIIAFFGAPMPMEDHAQAACRTAIGMQRKLAELRTKWQSEGEKWPRIVHDMRMRIGINSGAITTGNMGSAVRMNYTMMGDAVNLAARLESAAKQYGVYTMVSDFTYRLVRNDFEVRLVDKITVVGKSEPVLVYELLGEKGSIDEEIEEMVAIYNEGIEAYFAQDWDKAIHALSESEKMEPYRAAAPKGMSPSKKMIEYCKGFKETPPGPDWDGVSALTSK